MLLCQDSASGPIDVKIGMSEDPFRRAARLSAEADLKPRQLAYCKLPSRELARQAEMFLHRAYAPWHKRGEWFTVAAADKAEYNRRWLAVFALLQQDQGYLLQWTRVSMQPLMAQRATNRAATRTSYVFEWYAEHKAVRDSRQPCC